MNKITQPTRLATQELQLPDPCLIFILCFFFYSLNSPHGQRHAQTESAEAGVAIRFTEREKEKKLLVSRLNHSFNLTGRHKKSAPYYTDTQMHKTHMRTLTPTDTHMQAHTHAE